MPPLFIGHALRLLIWSDSLYLGFYFVYLSYFFIAFTSVLFTIIPRHGLDRSMRLDPEELKRAGYELVVRERSFDVRVAKYSVARIYETNKGKSFRCMPTASGLWAMVLLPLVPGLIIVVFPFSLYVYDRCWKGLKTVIERMKDVPVQEEKGVDALMMDSLTEAYTLARNAADDHRAELQDRSIIIVIFALVGWVALLALCGPYPVQNDSFVWKLGLGTLLLTSLTLIGILILRKWSKTLVREEELWADKLLAAMRGAVPEEGSTVELLMRACYEVPRWLEVNRRGTWRKDPWMALLILILLDSGVMAIMSYGSIWWGFYVLGLASLSIGSILFIDHHRRANKESKELRKDWDRKMTELGAIIGPPGER